MRIQTRRDGSFFVTCTISGVSIEYCGRGRPPLYHPDVLKARKAKLRSDKYAARKAEQRAEKQERSKVLRAA